MQNEYDNDINETLNNDANNTVVLAFQTDFGNNHADEDIARYRCSGGSMLLYTPLCKLCEYYKESNILWNSIR